VTQEDRDPPPLGADLLALLAGFISVLGMSQWALSFAINIARQLSSFDAPTR
jgi:hypothetical protein